MTRYLLDTGIAGDYVHRRHGVYERAREAVARGGRVGLCVPVLAELWYGVEYSDTRERNAERLRRTLPDLVVWPFNEADPSGGPAWVGRCCFLRALGRFGVRRALVGGPRESRRAATS